MMKVSSFYILTRYFIESLINTNFLNSDLDSTDTFNVQQISSYLNNEAGNKIKIMKRLTDMK